MNSNDKALQILLAFAPDNQPLRTIDVSKKLGINNATTNRILITLKNNGFVVQDPATHRYSLGPAVVQLGRAVRRSMDGRLVSLAKPYLETLRNKVGESVHLEVIYGGRIFLVFGARGKRQVIATPQVGDQMSAHANAGAKVIIAHSSIDIVKKHLQGPLTAYTKNTITSPARLKKEYEQIKKAGVAHDRGEFDEDIHAVAAPVFDHEGIVTAAVAIVAPSYRMKDSIDSGSLELLKETAQAVSGRLAKL